MTFHLMTLTDVKDLFDMFDRDKNGVVTKEELIATFKDLKLPITDKHADKLILQFDKNSDGMLEFPEFVELIRRYMSVQDFPVHGMFHYFDMDHDGFITVDEFVKSMRCLGVDMNYASAEKILAQYYIDGTKKINYESFNMVMRRYM